MHSFQKNIFLGDEIFAPIYFAVCRAAVSFPSFLRLPHALFVKRICTVISYSVGYSVVKEHFGADFLGLFSCSYSLAELFAPLYWITEKTPKY